MIELYGLHSPHTDLILKTANDALRRFGIEKSDVYVEITLVDEADIQELNKEKRGLDEITDVLSFQNLENVKFPFVRTDYQEFNTTEGVILGEIFICLKRADEQAEAYQHSLTRELSFLTCHGMLHLLGFDHPNEEELKKMTNLTEEILAKKPFKSGFVAVMGRPNAGKSTLVNTIVGEKVSIVSWKPQTTRNKIKGIYNQEDCQIVFIDTPGLHAPKNNLGKFMMKSARGALEGIDAVLYLVDCEKGYSDIDRENLENYCANGLNTIAVVNKTDHVTSEKVFEILTKLKEITALKAIVPVSALKNRNIAPLLDEIKRLLTDTVKYYDDDAYTDRNMRFVAAEIIREKALRLLDKEVPYGIGIDITEYKQRETGNIIDISADIICEKAAHKPIILGKGGAMIKKIATYSRQDLEEISGEKIFLTLFVKVKDEWRDSTLVLKDLGYNEE